MLSESKMKVKAFQAILTFKFVFNTGYENNTVYRKSFITFEKEKMGFPFANPISNRKINRCTCALMHADKFQHSFRRQ